MSESPTEYVYLIGSEASPLVKIGRSVDLARRLADIQFMSPVRLSLLWQVEGDAELEAALHRLFRLYRSHGEWFDFAGHDAVEVVGDAVMLGLHETSTEAIDLDGPPPLRHGDVVRISPTWGGPRYGVVRGVMVKPMVGGVTSYAVGAPGGARAASYSFRPSEVQLVSGLRGLPDVEKLWEKYSVDPVEWLAHGPAATQVLGSAS